jgi:hypothetical protein
LASTSTPTLPAAARPISPLPARSSAARASSSAALRATRRACTVTPCRRPSASACLVAATVVPARWTTPVNGSNQAPPNVAAREAAA